MSSKNLNSERYDWLQSLLYYAALVIATMIASSLALSLIVRIGFHSGWGELGTIGDFWGGHLNGLALVFFAISLLLQQREFRRQLDGQRLGSLLERLRIEAEGFKFAVVDEAQAGKSNRRIQNGAAEFAEKLSLQLHSRLNGSIAYDAQRVILIVKLYDAGLQILEKWNHGTDATDRLILDSLVPPPIRMVAEQEIASRAELQREARGIREKSVELADGLASLVEDGWIFRTTHVASLGWIGMIKRELVEDTVTYDCGERYYQEPAEALSAALIQLQGAQLSGLP
jgi:hypothetical protein